METKQIPFLALIILLFASTVYGDPGIVLTTNDTYTVDPTVNFNYGLQPTINTSMGLSFWKFNNTNATSHLISSITFKFRPTVAICTSSGNCWKELFWIPNNTWDERLLNWSNRPADMDSKRIITGIATSNSATNRTSADFFTINTDWAGGSTRGYLNQSAVITELYKNDIISFIMNATIFSPGSGVVGSNGTVDSKEGSDVNPGALNITLVESLNGTRTNTDMTGFTELDFETGVNISNVFFLENDFDYRSGINSIAPNVAQNISIAPALYSTSLENDLSTRIVDCYFSSYSFTFQNPNVIPRTYSYYCFNLSARHQGKNFFGMIKVINNTNVRGNSSPEFDYYYFVSSPGYAIFSNPAFSPNPPQVGLNLTVGTITTIPLNNTFMFFRYNVTGNFTAWGSVQGQTTSYTMSHAFILNNIFIVASNYEIYFTGSDGTTTYTSQTFNFTVGYPNFQQATNNSALAAGLNALVNSNVVPNPSAALWFFSAIIIVMSTLIGYWFMGMKGAILCLVSVVTTLGLIQFIPSYIFIPILAIAAAIIVKWGRGLFGSDSGGS